MPVFTVVPGDVLRVVSYCTAPGQVATNSRDWQVTSMIGGSSTFSGGILADFDTALASLLIPILSSGAQYYGAQMYKRTPVGPAPRPDQSNINVGAGSAGAGLLPTQTCGLISLYSDTLGKTGQGRVYLPFPSPASSEANGTPTAAYAVLAADVGSYFSNSHVAVVGPVTVTLDPCLYIPGGPPPKFLTNFTVRDAWATQRKRGAFGKANSLPF